MSNLITEVNDENTPDKSYLSGVVTVNADERQDNYIDGGAYG